MAKLDSANKLVEGLAGENTRWTANVKYLKGNKRNSIGDSLLAAAFVSYIGAFSAKLRNDLWSNTWYANITGNTIPITDGITPLKILTNEA